LADGLRQNSTIDFIQLQKKKIMKLWKKLTEKGFKHNSHRANFQPKTYILDYLNLLIKSFLKKIYCFLKIDLL